jgi:hypothetical protein
MPSIKRYILPAGAGGQVMSFAVGALLTLVAANKFPAMTESMVKKTIALILAILDLTNFLNFLSTLFS